MLKKEDFDKIKDKICKLKLSSQKLSDRITQGIPRSAQPAQPVRMEPEAAAPAGTEFPKEEELRELSLLKDKENEYLESLARQEQQLQFANTKLANIEYEKKNLLGQFDALAKNNSDLLSKLEVLEKERNELLGKLKILEGRVNEVENRVSLKYILNIVEEFISEFMRHSRDTLGMIYESIHMCKESADLQKPQKEKIAFVEEQVQNLLGVLAESIRKYHFDELKYKTADLNKIITDAVNNVIEKSRVQGVTLTCRLPEKGFFISTDPVLFGEVIEAIILNSVESMIKGGKLDIVYEFTGREVRLVFSDTGPGIPSHLIDKIHKPFFTTKKGHFGLGLTRANWIMQLLKYEMKIESAAGAGARVRIVIPVEQEKIA